MKTIEANLLDFPSGINMIFHQANTENVMGAGIASQIRKRYPQAYKADKDHFVPKGRERLGNYTMALVNEEKISKDNYNLVCNLYGQMLNEDSIFGVRTDYFALRDALRSCLDLHTTFSGYYKDAICGFPWLMSSNLGGGDFKIVRHIVEETMEEFNLTGYWVKYKT